MNHEGVSISSPLTMLRPRALRYSGRGAAHTLAFTKRCGAAGKAGAAGLAPGLAAAGRATGAVASAGRRQWQPAQWRWQKRSCGSRG